MPRYLQATTERFPVAGSFTISRGTRTHADVVTCIIREGSFTGRGECVPYPRYGESIKGVLADIEAMAERVAAGLTRQELQLAMKPGAARNAVDCALWDLEAKISGRGAAEQVLGQAAKPLVTAYTISLADPETMAAKTAENAGRPLLKIKTGTTDDEARLRAVRAAAPEARIIIDANEGWNDDNIEYYLRLAAELKISLIEQPLPASKDMILSRIDHPVLICADESVHSTKDLAGLRDRYDAINIKLDKTGGLTEALVMKTEAERLGFTIMVGCMLGTSLGMAPAVLAAQGTAFADLDGPLLLAQDREPGLVYEGSLVYPAPPELWG
ncbi:L-Ala-D/L-Glu epimerase [Rhizobium rhizogenes]|uniref:Dipeptide epimerase n=1 Tax=Rhizobium rhizogenes TaxID=359 RepID=A0AAN2A3X6_RHIRH|nr:MULTISPECIES: N-acetyl-D-Glu racemase DgcA [Rhizobium/Agrobacterium group]AQS61643.1 dipeptide epimerase [Rhizobium rhizogenes]MCZ7443147.1 dipeptide epimerase [Rhizobium rhizogenes]NSZ79132.1 dipeptide epimerase [Agrobacterium tumefaciens]OAM65912.1 dipeptide epimerase [Rhizobium rhizogenes]CAD0211425.1 L-Ala-D/L-Glu epimerase [Rhizobium rhizogenes]